MTNCGSGHSALHDCDSVSTPVRGAHHASSKSLHVPPIRQITQNSQMTCIRLRTLATNLSRPRSGSPPVLSSVRTLSFPTPKHRLHRHLVFSSTSPYSSGSKMTKAMLGEAASVRPTLAISAHEDDPEIRAKYRPFLLGDEIESSDWIAELELDAVMEMARQNIESTGSRLKVLVLYGSLRKR